jgi:UDP-N-acetylglucosamine 2-epimerase
MDETIAYLGINYLDLITQLGEEGAAEHYQAYGRYGFRPLNFMRRLIEVLQPDVVVATNSPRSERAVLDVAGELGIPTIGMVDLFGQEGDTYVSHAQRPDWTCVISEGVRRRLVSRGFLAERVVVTGNPAFDGLFTAASAKAAERFILERGWGGLVPILWAGHLESPDSSAPSLAGPMFALAVERQLRTYVQGQKKCALIVRYHPSQWHLFPQLSAQARVHFSIPSKDPIHSVILASGVVVVQNSTVGLEAAIAGRPVVSLEFAESVRSSFSLADLGISLPCHAMVDLGLIIEHALSQTKRHPSEYVSDGRAASRVAHVVLDAMLSTR